MSSKFITLSISFFGFFGIVSLAHATAKRLPSVGEFVVEGIQGEVFYKPPFDIGWYRLKKSDRLQAGALVDVREGGVVTFTTKSATRNIWNGRVVINEPILVRLSDELLRRLKLKSYFTDRIPEKALKDQKGEIELFFKNAWERIAIYFKAGKLDERFANKMKSKKGENSDVGIRFKNLSIVYPLDGAAINMMDLPSSLNIVWVNPDRKRRKYHIYIWQHTTFFETPYAATSADNYAVPIQSPGSYFLMVKSADGRYSSKPHIVHIHQGFPHASDAVEVNPAVQIEFNLPKNYAVFLTEESAATVNFRWIAPEVIGGARPSTFLNIKRKLKTERHDVTNKEFFTADLKPGSYEYWMEQGLKESNDFFSTERRNLEVNRISDKLASRDFKSVLKRAVEARNQRTFYLDLQDQSQSE